MATCPSCGLRYGDAGAACPRCGAAAPAGAGTAPRSPRLVPPPLDLGAVTRSALDPTPEPRPSSSTPTGWLSSTGAIDHGRFQPGVVLGGRYRIVGRLGRGGMGEVYRADDLKLGQSVALKFLAPDVDQDPARLTQLHTEVRLARQVSHPNVCTVYDIDEADGHTFLSMEYVDGEHLGSLLRRIGRFPQDRALEIARQICAGLAAAHERGVVHRDLKPGNVMIDGAGQVRVTDFGLAGASGEVLRAGTPAYMAPEQIAGGEVTVRSDIYALGLVLYETFTGRRALEGRNVAELIHRREQHGIAPPSTIVGDLDPRIDRAIMRCLEPEPEARPASALTVAAMLPGGDPLAAAVAAGQTPSPEMVAAAGQTDAVRGRSATLAALWIAVALVLVTLAYQRIQLVNLAAIPKPPAALADRALEATARLGYPVPPADSAAGFFVSTDYLEFVMRQPSRPAGWSHLAGMRPVPLRFWYRTSPRAIVPMGQTAGADATDPPLNVAGMTLAIVDTAGRLAEFHAVPEPIDPATPGHATDWSVPLELAGLDPASLTPATPRWVPLVYADERAAWEGPLPERPELTVRLEAAAYKGRVVFFGLTGPWTRSERAATDAVSRFASVMSAIASVTVLALLVAGALLAGRNLRGGRGDRVGALRASTFVFLTSLAGWTLGATHVADVGVEVDRVFHAIALALFQAAVLWLTYLGLEPYVRRAAPASLIGWTRLVGGRWKDPHVGMDGLAGISAGLLMTLCYTAYYLLPPAVGQPAPMPAITDLFTLMGTRFVLASFAGRVTDAVVSGMLATVGIVGILILVRRRRLGALVSVLVFTPVVVDGMFSPGYPGLALVLAALIFTVLTVLTLRFGLLATIAAIVTHFLLLRAPLTTDLGSWRGAASLWHLGAVAALGLLALYAARSGERRERVQQLAVARA